MVMGRSRGRGAGGPGARACTPPWPRPRRTTTGPARPSSPCCPPPRAACPRARRRSPVSSTLCSASPHVIGVGGDGASLIDFDHAVYGDFPLMLAIIGVATFLLLARAFRSVLLAAKAVVFNLISLAAAYGVLTWVWQDGHGSDALWGIPATGAITMWVPLMVFAFLFGLSMDYEVFILSRIREAYDASGDAHARGHRGPGPDRPAGHQRGGDPDAQLPVHVHRAADRPEGPGHRARRRHPHRRGSGPLPAGPGAGRAVRPGELVAAGRAGPGAPGSGRGPGPACSARRRAGPGRPGRTGAERQVSALA